MVALQVQLKRLGLDLAAEHGEEVNTEGLAFMYEDMSSESMV